MLDNAIEAKAIFLRAADLIAEAARKIVRGREAQQRTKVFTTAVIEACGGKWPLRNADVERQHGRVKWFSEVKGYGFIESDAGGELFVHCSAITGAGDHMPEAEDRVEFATVRTAKGLQARDVRILA